MHRYWSDFGEVDSIPTEKGVRIKLRFAVEIDNIVLPLLPKRRLVVLSRDSSEFAVCAELLAFEARHPRP